MISPVGRFILLFVLLTQAIALKAQETYLFPHSGLQRSYNLYLPDDLPSNAPLVFVLHGYASTAEQIMTYAEMNQQADEHKFAVCYPQGTVDFNGVNHWNARLSISETDDIGFLSALAQYLQRTWALDPERTFACGHSNGGFMSYTLACEAPGIFRAVASMAGTMSGYTWDNRKAAVPVPVLQIHGVNDQTVPIDGSISWQGWAGAPPVDSVMAFWAEVNQCTAFRSVFIPNLTHAIYYTGGVEGNEVWYFKINNWGHAWPNSNISAHTGTIAGEVIWSFFDQMSSRISHAETTNFASQIRVYPNPAKQSFTLDAPDFSPGPFTVHSMTGQIIFSGWYRGSAQEVKLPHCAPGRYYVRLLHGVAQLVILH